ncbi:MAG: peptidoglycan-associated lipoprotein Pal [Pseudomonadota bacterium]
MNLKIVGAMMTITLLSACALTPDKSSEVELDGQSEQIEDTASSATGSSQSTESSQSIESSQLSESGSLTAEDIQVQDQQSQSAQATVEPGSERHFIDNVGDRVYFGFDQSSLNDDARKTLNGQIAWLQMHQGISVLVEGHADERGTREYNLALGERRADAVRDYMVAKGIASDRVTIISYGKERPVALGHNEDAWRLNRRSVTRIISVN